MESSVNQTYSLMLMLTNKCNQKCQFCLMRKEKEKILELPVNRINTFLTKYQNRIKEVHLMGGEPTLYSHFKELMEVLAEKGIDKITLISNGHSLDNEKYVSYLMKNNVQNFILSCHDLDEDKLAMNTGNKNNFKMINNAISAIKNLRGYVIINTIITKSNYKRIPEICKFLYLKGIRKYNICYVIPPTYLPYEFDQLLPQFSEMYPFLELAIDFLNTKEVDCNIAHIPYCILRKYRNKRMSSFEGNFCCVDYYGHTYMHSNDCTYNISVKRDKCSLCSYNDKCMGVYKAYIERFGWNEFNPITIDNY